MHPFSFLLHTLVHLFVTIHASDFLHLSPSIHHVGASDAVHVPYFVWKLLSDIWEFSFIHLHSYHSPRSTQPLSVPFIHLPPSFIFLLHVAFTLQGGPATEHLPVDSLN